ncbi:MAG TPA: class I SAM-dependent methyltransferase [Solirubrobacteraceae bacterium]
MIAAAVLWHDLECGGYDADLPLWRELAAAAGGPVLDVGAGTGRVSLDLARRGAEVVALDADGALLDALAGRAGALSLSTVCADARDFALGRRFALIIVPMQSVQLFGGAEGRAAFLRCAREHLAAGGRLALAISPVLEPGGGEPGGEPLTDLREIDGVVYSSRPVAVYGDGGRIAIERLREVVSPDGQREASDDVVWLDRVDAVTLMAEGEAAGLRALPLRLVPETAEYVGSTVVMLGG